jgi:hypothetical protein
MNLYQLGEDEVCTDGSVRKNLVIEQTEIVPPLVKSDGTAFLAKILDDTTTENILVLSEFECSLTEVVGSICFDAVLTS